MLQEATMAQLAQAQTESRAHKTYSWLDPGSAIRNLQKAHFSVWYPVSTELYPLFVEIDGDEPRELFELNGRQSGWTQRRKSLGSPAGEMEL